MQVDAPRYLDNSPKTHENPQASASSYSPCVAVQYLGSMGLPKGKLSLTRSDVESGKVGKYTDEEYNLYARHGKHTPYS